MTQKLDSTQSAIEVPGHPLFSFEDQVWLKSRYRRLYELAQERLRIQDELNTYYLNLGEYQRLQMPFHPESLLIEL